MGYIATGVIMLGFVAISLAGVAFIPDQVKEKFVEKVNKL